MTALSASLFGLGLLAWDGWRRYLKQIDRLDQIKKLEASLATRLKAIEATQAQHTRAIGIRAIQQAKAMGSES